MKLYNLLFSVFIAVLVTYLILNSLDYQPIQGDQGKGYTVGLLLTKESVFSLILLTLGIPGYFIFKRIFYQNRNRKN